jgi:hypothetical protein
LPEASPPNLAEVLHPALERLGFVVQRLDTPTQTLLMAAWLTAEHHTYQLLYTHARPAASPHTLSYVSLRVLGRLGAEPLVTDTHVRKLSDVRRLLLHNCRYKTARLAALAAGLLQPA